jgi:serine/threonine protein kinase
MSTCGANGLATLEGLDRALLTRTQQIVTEARLQSTLHHPHITEFSHMFTFGPSTFIVMELCANASLDHLLQSRGHLLAFEVRPMAIQLLGAVKYMNKKGVVHRDLKLQNVFLDANMDIKIGDFGLARSLTPGESLIDRCGTENYMAPEVLGPSRQGYDGSADVWSVGVLL